MHTRSLVAVGAALSYSRAVHVLTELQSRSAMREGVLLWYSLLPQAVQVVQALAFVVVE